MIKFTNVYVRISFYLIVSIIIISIQFHSQIEYKFEYKLS